VNACVIASHVAVPTAVPQYPGLQLSVHAPVLSRESQNAAKFVPASVITELPAQFPAGATGGGTSGTGGSDGHTHVHDVSCPSFQHFSCPFPTFRVAANDDSPLFDRTTGFSSPGLPQSHSPTLLITHRFAFGFPMSSPSTQTPTLNSSAAGSL
jgi:hypothetical protein